MRDAEKRTHFLNLLKQFKNDAFVKKLEFSAGLNSFERALIHEIADEIGGLKHESIGQGKHRHILVEKMSLEELEVPPGQTRKVSFNDDGWLVV